MEEAKRKIMVKKTASVLVNTGSFENVTVSQTIEAEVEYGNLDELKKKDSNITKLLDLLLKDTAEQTLAQTGRQRMVNNQPAELW